MQSESILNFWLGDPKLSQSWRETNQRDIPSSANRAVSCLCSLNLLTTSRSLPTAMKDWIALNMTPGVGPRVTARLLEHFGSAEAIFDAPPRDLCLLRLPPGTIESNSSRELHARAEDEIERVHTLGRDILALDDGVY